MTDLSNLIQDWAKDFPRRLTPTYNQRYQFQIRHCGNEEIRVRDGGEEIWADGINYETGELMEAKLGASQFCNKYKCLETKNVS